MTSLTDLRSTLDEHAETVGDTETIARLSAVHHRVAAVRRRRRAVGAAGLATVVAVAAGAALSTRPDRDAQPVGPVVLGQRAPGLMSSLGYTYRATGESEVFDGSGRLTVKATSAPRLVSWTTSDPDAVVRIRLGSGDTWTSDRSGFHDFFSVPADRAGTLRVSASHGSVGVATYDLTDAAPDGYTHDGITYRETVAGRDLLGAVVGDAGQAEASTTVVLPRGLASLSPICTGAPPGLRLHVDMAGDVATFGACDDTSTFDPAGAGGYSGGYAQPGRSVVARVYVTRGAHSTTPVPQGRYPDLRIGLGVYGTDDRTVVAGEDVAREVESGGHTWSLTATRSAQQGPLRVPAAGEDRLGWLTWGARGTVRTTFHVQGEIPQGGLFATGPGSAMGDLWMPAGHQVTATLAHGKGPLVLAIYTRTD
jgi:hypothetical protein